MGKVIVFFCSFLLLTACQFGDDSPDKEVIDELNPRPAVSFTYEGEEIDAKDVKSCFRNKCADEGAVTGNLSRNDLTRGLDTSEVKNGDSIKVETQGIEPSEASYSNMFTRGGARSSEDHILERREIEVNGTNKEDGKESYVIYLEWTNEEDEFLGSMTKAFEIEIVD
ncbi:hypothetical protein [Halobacillus massiliensis]|uniref:hypothetical protein n=1 Tax=Halobacillus massiliensis TaxID=1926286 RepID=UPI0009E535C4|nr:hypothetical protein [Halobacillus massiliensis]